MATPAAWTITLALIEAGVILALAWACRRLHRERLALRERVDFWVNLHNDAHDSWREQFRAAWAASNEVKRQAGIIADLNARAHQLKNRLQEYTDEELAASALPARSDRSPGVCVGAESRTPPWGRKRKA
jgi:hypothetical protein